jgi:hypothetical protein
MAHVGRCAAFHHRAEQIEELLHKLALALETALRTS